MRSAFSGASVVGDPDRAAGRLGGDRRVELGVRGEPPRAVDDDPDREPDLAADDRRLQLAVAQLHDLGGDAVNPQVGVAGAGGRGRRQRGVGQLVPRQREEVGVDTSARCHASTVVAHNDAVGRQPVRRSVRNAVVGYALLAPSLFGVVTFLLLPMLVVVWLSLHRWDLLGPIEYVGLGNWRSVLDRCDVRHLAGGHRRRSSLLVVPLQTVLGLFAAALLAREPAGQRLLPHALRAAVDLLAAGDRGAVAVDPGPHRRRGQHRARPSRRMADRSRRWRCRSSRRSRCGPTSAT